MKYLLNNTWFNPAFNKCIIAISIMKPNTWNLHSKKNTIWGNISETYTNKFWKNFLLWKRVTSYTLFIPKQFFNNFIKTMYLLQS